LVSEIQDHGESGTTGEPSPAYIAEAMSSSTLRLLRRLLDVSQQSAPVVARRAGLSHTELSAMELLTRQPLGPGDLARHLGVTSAAASGIVDRLVARGHVRREAHEVDRRRTQVVVTDSGRADMLRHLMPMFLALAELDRDLPADDRAVIDAYLARAVAAIERLL
jgi:DNA-binding MarR family transcriptional regulator